MIAIWLMFLAAQPGLRAQTTNAAPEATEAPDFKEVYDLVRAHLTGMSEAELNRMVVQGLVSALGPKVSLLAEATATNAPAETPPVSKSSLFDGDIAYVRVGRVADGLAQAVGEACRKFGATNKVKGVVMDLRYARGDDYAAAAATADLFLKKERPLLNWGNGVVKSKEKNDAITWPAAVLVNRQTTGAAEALAAVLRDAGAGLILGSKTAGQALVAQEFPLKNGQRLRIATAPVQLGDGTTLSGQGLKPDIAVDVNPEDEKAYFGDAFKLPPRAELFAGAGLSSTNPAAATNRAARRARFNEAELVRERREGASVEPDSGVSREREPETPVVHDPALARALDLLKGLAVVHQSRAQ